MPFISGDVVAERYRLVRRLGINGPRETWVVADLQGCERVLKLMYFGGDTRWQELKLLEREAQTLKSLDHPGIPALVESFWSERVEGHYFCLVQQYVPGHSLLEQLQSGVRLGEAELEQLTTQMLDILQYLHTLTPPVIHRDLKPSNILAGDDGRYHLVDFGGVQARVAGGATFTVVGTFGYMPPEQFAGQAVPASDLYALGATLVHLATGVDPTELPRQGLRLRFEDRLPLGSDWKLWLGRMLEPDLERRYGRADLAQAILKARKTLAPYVVQQGLVPVKTDGLESLFVLLASGALFSVLGVGSCFFAWLIAAQFAETNPAVSLFVFFTVFFGLVGGLFRLARLMQR